MQRLGIMTNEGATWLHKERREGVEIDPLDAIGCTESKNNRKEEGPNYYHLL